MTWPRWDHSVVAPFGLTEASSPGVSLRATTSNLGLHFGGGRWGLAASLYRYNQPRPATPCRSAALSWASRPFQQASDTKRAGTWSFGPFRHQASQPRSVSRQSTLWSGRLMSGIVSTGAGRLGFACRSNVPRENGFGPRQSKLLVETERRGPVSPEHGSVDRVPRLQCRPVSNKGLSGSTRDLRSRVAEQAARTGLSTSWERLGGHLSMVMIREKAGIFYYRPQQVCQRELRSSVLSPRPKYVIIRGGQAACRSGQPGGDTL